MQGTKPRKNGLNIFIPSNFKYKIYNIHMVQDLIKQLKAYKKKHLLKVIEGIHVRVEDGNCVCN